MLPNTSSDRDPAKQRPVLSEHDFEADLGTPFALSSSVATDACSVDVILAALEAAKPGGVMLEHAVFALRGLLASATAQGLHAAGGARLNELEAAFRDLGAPLLGVVAGRLPDDTVMCGVAAAAGFLHQLQLPPQARADVAFLREYVEFVALLADELDALVRRRRIEANGDRFRRLLRIQDAARAEPAPGAALN